MSTWEKLLIVVRENLFVTDPAKKAYTNITKFRWTSNYVKSIALLIILNTFITDNIDLFF